MLKRADEVVTENYRKIEKALKGASEAKRASMIQEFSLDKAFNPDGTLKPDFLTGESSASAESDGEFKLSRTGKALNYDYSKSFSQQLDDYQNGQFPQRDSFIVGPTTEPLKKIGLNALPMTINQKHVDYALNGTKDLDHHIGRALLDQIPDAIKEPVAVISSKTSPNSSIVVLIELMHNGKNIIAPVYVDSAGHQNNLRIDANAIASVYPRGNAITGLLQDAINEESKGNVGVYYYNTKKATALISGGKVTMPNWLKLNDGFNHSIREKGSPVKPKFENVTNSKQFKRWFGDWEKNPDTASKVVNEDGTPKIVYHQTDADFSIFDTRHEGAGTSDNETPFGIFLKPDDGDIGLRGKKQIALYARIINPFTVADRADLRAKLKKLSPKYAELSTAVEALEVEYSIKTEEAARAWSDYAKNFRANNPDAPADALNEDALFQRLYDAEDLLTEEWIEKEATLTSQMKEEITQALKAAGYDVVNIQRKTITADTSIQENGASAHNPVEHDVSAAIGGKDQQLNIVNKTPQHTPEALAGSNATTNSIPNSSEIVNPSDENNQKNLENPPKSSLPRQPSATTPVSCSTSTATLWKALMPPHNLLPCVTPTPSSRHASRRVLRGTTA